MNAKCPVCAHRFELGKRSQFLNWHLSRRSAPCPDCDTELVWGRKAHACMWGGLLLSVIFYGALIGIAYGAKVGALLGFAAPQPVEKTEQEFWLIILAVASLALATFGFWRLRLTRYHAAK
jgi:hypothetical protein